MPVILDGETLELIENVFRDDLKRHLKAIDDIGPMSEVERSALEGSIRAEWRIRRAQAYRTARGESEEQARLGIAKRYLFGSPEDRERARQHGQRLFNERIGPL